jgi:hypothetical protein
MKKFKIIVLCCILATIGCTKMDIEPIPPQPKPLTDIFLTSESSITDGEEVMFKLTSDSVYVLKIVDKSSGQVLSKEKIKGIIGANKIKIYTKSLPSKYLYLVLEDGNKKEMNKTTIIAK